MNHEWRDLLARENQLPPIGDWRVWLLLAGRGFGKLLDVRTPIPTPGGWSTMGNLQVGDAVFDEAGRPCRVTWVSAVQVERTYRISFSDGAEIIAGASHQWVTWTHAERKAYLRSTHETDVRAFPNSWPAWRVRRLPTVWLSRDVAEQALELHRAGKSMRAIERETGISRNALRKHILAGSFLSPVPSVRRDSIGPQIRTTEQIRLTLRQGRRGDLNHSIPITRPLELPAAELPIDPYVLGVWLGDGSSRSAEITTDDDEVLQQIEQAGYRIGTDPRGGGTARTWTIGGASVVRDSVTGRFRANSSLHSILRSEGLLNSKRSPRPISPGKCRTALGAAARLDG